MADENKNGGDFGGAWLLLFVIVVLVVLFQAARGGMGSSGMFGEGIRTGSPSRTGTVEEKLSHERAINRNTTNKIFRASPPASPESYFFIAFGNTAATDPGQEYISLYYSSSASEKIIINGWSVENILGARGVITAPFPISVEPGTRVVIVSGPGLALFSPLQKEWRVYLGRGQELWHSVHDTITLRAFPGNVISRFSY